MKPQYRPLVPPSDQGKRRPEVRELYVRTRRKRPVVQDRAHQQLAWFTDSDMLRIGGGMTLGTLAVLGALGFVAWRLFDYGVHGD